MIWGVCERVGLIDGVLFHSCHSAALWFPAYAGVMGRGVVERMVLLG